MELIVSSSHIWLSNQPIDFRRSIDGLCDVVNTQLGKNPGDGIFIFYNRARNKLKILAWHGNGFVLLYKKLERGHFFVTALNENEPMLTNQQLSWLLAGLDWKTMTTFGTLTYRDFC